MKRWLASWLVACTTPTAPSAVAIRSPTPPPLRPSTPAMLPLPSLTTPGALYLLTADDGHARCERWQIVPPDDDDRSRGELFHVEDGVRRRIDFRSTTSQLDIEAVWIEGDTTVRTACQVRRIARELPNWIDVGGARWFHDVAGCAAAIANRDRVATDFGANCRFAPPPPPRRAAATRAAIERVLVGGGTLWAPSEQAHECAPIAVRIGRDDGVMTTRVGRGDSRGTARWRFSYRDGELTTVDDGVTYDRARNTGRYGTLCATRTRGEWRASAVWFGAPLYRSSGDCRAGLAAERARLHWLPPTDGPSPVVADVPPAIPSC